jgi:hypothetical protein
MKKFLVGFVIVIVAIVLGVGASFGGATVVSKVAGQQLAASAAQGQSFRMNRQGSNKMGPGMHRNGMPGWQQGQPGMGPGFQNRAPFGGQNSPNWGPGSGAPGQCWNGNQNGPNGQNGQNSQNGQDGQNYGCQNMRPGGRMWPRR